MAELIRWIDFLVLTSLGLLAFGIQVWALSDVLRTPASSFERVYKRTKVFWGALTGGATFFGFLYIIGPLLSLGTVFGPVPPSRGFGMLMVLAGVTAASIYLADVRPALEEVRGRGKGRGTSW